MFGEMAICYVHDYWLRHVPATAVVEYQRVEIAAVVYVALN